MTCPKHGIMDSCTELIGGGEENIKHFEGKFCTACYFEWFHNNITKVEEVDP